MSKVRRVLVPTDFSEQSQQAVDYACSLIVDSASADSGACKPQLHLVHIVSDTPGGDGQAARLREQLERLGRSVSEQSELAMETHREVVPGDPANVITGYARDHDIDMIIMGTHGRTGLSHFALGSVAERVVRTSDCPVLVIGPRKQNRNVTLVRAAETIGQELGERFPASRDEGISQMCAILQEKLDLHSVTSDRQVERLLSNDWIRWESGDPGEWSVMEGVEFVEESEPVFNAGTESQAIDLIERARRLRATDVHIDPAGANEVMVRLRIDGKLEEYCRLSSVIGEHLENQLKTLADLDIAEPFRPQEGRVRLPDSVSDLEVRITTARVAAGDAIALRLFDGKNIALPMGSLGFSGESMELVDEMLRLGEGLVLVTGPTGAGKSTTVYSMLEMLGGPESNIVSIEDPVEYAVPFVRQMAVDAKHDITMASGLKTILRMDPDVIFVGEIRDAEAARMAMQAASSGKYVLTTLHTRDVASTVTALRDMGIGDRSIAGNLTGIINQRLRRRLCSSCKTSRKPTEEEMRRFKVAGLTPPASVAMPGGCELCRDTGFRGRVGVFEVALVDATLANAISGGDSENHLKELLRSKGVASLLTDALSKAAAGVTSFEEAIAVHWLG